MGPIVTNSEYSSRSVMSCGRLFTMRLVVVLVASEPLPQPPELRPRPVKELVEALLKWPT